MTIYPTVIVGNIRGGVAARALELGLACHGPDEGRALAAIRTTVAIWARALESDGLLEGSLARNGVRWEGSGEPISVEPIVTTVIS